MEISQFRNLSAKKEKIYICEKCFLYECVCEQDRLERLKGDEVEIKAFHSAKVGSRLWRKINECPCDLHSKDAKEPVRKASKSKGKEEKELARKASKSKVKENKEEKAEKKAPKKSVKDQKEEPKKMQKSNGQVVDKKEKKTNKQ